MKRIISLVFLTGFFFSDFAQAASWHCSTDVTSARLARDVFQNHDQTVAVAPSSISVVTVLAEGAAVNDFKLTFQQLSNDSLALSLENTKGALDPDTGGPLPTTYAIVSRNSTYIDLFTSSGDLTFSSHCSLK